MDGPTDVPFTNRSVSVRIQLHSHCQSAPHNQNEEHTDTRIYILRTKRGQPRNNRIVWSCPRNERDFCEHRTFANELFFFVIHWFHSGRFAVPLALYSVVFDYFASPVLFLMVLFFFLLFFSIIYGTSLCSWLPISFFETQLLTLHSNGFCVSANWPLRWRRRPTTTHIHMHTWILYSDSDSPRPRHTHTHSNCKLM